MDRRPQPLIRAVSSKPEGHLEGGSIATGRAASVDLATELWPLTCTRPRTSIQRSRRTADLPAAMGLSKKNAKLSSVGHFQSEQAFTPPTHFRTLFGFSEKFGNCRPPLMYTLNSEPKALTGDKSEGIKSRDAAEAFIRGFSPVKAEGEEFNVLILSYTRELSRPFKENKG